MPADTLLVDGVELKLTGGSELSPVWYGVRGALSFQVRNGGSRYYWTGSLCIDTRNTEHKVRELWIVGTVEVQPGTPESCASKLTALVAGVRAALEVPRG